MKKHSGKLDCSSSAEQRTTFRILEQGVESGRELAEKIHLRAPSLPLILSSGYDMEESPGKPGGNSFPPC